MLPPRVVNEWNENNVWTQAQLIAYDQIRRYEEDEDKNEMYKMLSASMGAKRAGG